MATSLYSILEEIYKDPKQWKYYNGERGDYKSYDFLSYDFSRCFIQQYFISGEKSILAESIYRLSPLRQIHTVSTYFLGLYLYKFLKVSNYRKYKPSFRYLWFLTCLFHDFGYLIEDGIEPNWTRDIKFDIYKCLKIPPELQTYYDIDTLQEYSKYRHNIDHGIEGGRKLYDLLKKNYAHYQEKWAIQNDTPPQDEFLYRNKIWFRKSHENYYSEAALNIMLHNIWFCNDSHDIDKYTPKLEKLINKKLKFTYSAALLFVLIFADTIEPIKKIKVNNNASADEKKAAEEINVNNYKNILDNIFLSTEDQKLKITFNKLALSKIDYKYDEWIKSICGMREWIDLAIEESDDTISIDFCIGK